MRSALSQGSNASGTGGQSRDLAIISKHRSFVHDRVELLLQHLDDSVSSAN